MDSIETLIKQTIATNVISQFNENDDIRQEDDFGSFDDTIINNNDFGNFNGEQDADNTAIVNTLENVPDLWQHLLSQIYNDEPLESFTGNAPKSIKKYVLEEASESLYSRLTWDSVTRYMEDDTGIPKVKWHQSEIERFYLNALACKRSATPLITTPTMLNTVEISQEPGEIMKPALNTLIGSVSMDHPTTSIANNTSDKRSSVFSFSSLSRFLPHLSRTNLPKSPTSPVSSPIAASRGFSRRHLQQQQQQQPISPNDAVNHLDISALTQDASSSTKSLNFVAEPSSLSTSKQTQSMDLFDLTDDLTTVIKSPTQPQFSLEPLIPIHTLSPIRRNTTPANIHSEIKPNVTEFDTIQDDDFGDFAAEQGFYDFGNFGVVQSPQTPVKSTPLHFIDDDPFGILGNCKNKTLENEPYGIANSSQSPSSAQQSNNLLVGIDSCYSQNPLIFTSASTSIASIKMLTSTNSGLIEKSFETAVNTTNNSVRHDLLDLDHTFVEVDQTPNSDPDATVADDDDWGDWTF